MHAACASGCAECVSLLLRAGAEPDSRLSIGGREGVTSASERHSKTALVLAAEKGHVGALSALLEGGADVGALATLRTAQSTSSTSALWAARRGGHRAAAELLEAAGAEEVATTTLHAASPAGAGEERDGGVDAAADGGVEV